MSETVLADGVKQVVAALSSFKDQYGEKVVNTTLETVSYMAMNDLLQSFMGIIFAVIVIMISLKTIKSPAPDTSKMDIIDRIDSESFTTAKQFISYAAIAFMSIVMLANISSMSNIITWKSISKPEIYLTYKLIKKL